MKRRRICWPNPSRICLSEGCEDCKKGDFKLYGQISRYISQQGDSEDLRKAWHEGLKNNFWNQVEIKG